MAYASSSIGGSKAATSEPHGKSGSGTFSSKGSTGAKSEPSGSMKGGGMTTKGNAKKL
jgi:hypothetical protein